MDWAGVGGKALATVDFERSNPSANPGLISTPVRESSSSAAVEWCWLSRCSLVCLALLFGLWSRISGLPWATPSVLGAIAIAVGAECRPRLVMRPMRLIVEFSLAVRCCLAGSLGFSGRGGIAFSADGSFD